MMFSMTTQAWGPIGHRVVGQIAFEHLNPKTKKEITKILENERLSMVSTWPDFIRSDRAWDKAVTWHYVTIPDGQTYAQIEKEKSGDIVEAIERFKDELKSKKVNLEQKKIALKFLVHLVGDIHQPLHVGKPGDKGGNDVKVKWFKEETNLHHVWDESLINFQQLSFSEYVQWINQVKPIELKQWQADSIEIWIEENKSLRSQVYDIGDGRLGYDYNFKNIKTVNERLVKSGVRLAGILNSLFK